MISFAGLALSPVSLSCDCVQLPSLQECYNRETAVFYGTCISGKVVPRERTEEGGWTKTKRQYVFRVSKNYKGEKKDEIIIETGFGGGDCGFSFNIGREYLVYASGPDEALRTSICKRTCGPEKDYERMDEDMKFLDELIKEAK
jgi:hypothetical protein